MAWVRETDNGLGDLEFVEHKDGVPWFDAPSPRWWERPFHRHQPQTRGFLGELVERCRCGATRLDGYGPWIKD
jgi:hypothetical protein